MVCCATACGASTTTFACAIGTPGRKHSEVTEIKATGAACLAEREGITVEVENLYYYLGKAFSPLGSAIRLRTSTDRKEAIEAEWSRPLFSVAGTKEQKVLNFARHNSELAGIYLPGNRHCCGNACKLSMICGKHQITT